MNKKFKYYRLIYKKFGAASIWFLLQSKILKNKLYNRKIKGLKHPVFLSNFQADVTTLFQIFFAKEYKVPKDLSPVFIIDCGANIGLSAIYFASKYPAAKIIAIEPDKQNFEVLQKNASFYGNITCLNKAVWSGPASMEMIDMGTGNWSLRVKESAPGKENTIEAVGIFQLMEEYKFLVIDILKIDIEGAEKELFSKNYIDWLCKIKWMAIELHENIDEMIPSIFYKALQGLKYKKYQQGENLICDFR
ncbi:MAG: FkbM family methyltransferase [Niastella sp.]|nr:FkbM family methyltransferase [Niastella sp.]